MTYAILESPMAVENYVATLKVIPVTDGDRCYVEWTAEFDCRPEREAELVDLIGRAVFLAGLKALQGRFAPAMNAVVKVSRSAVIDAPVDVLWRLLRDFNSHGTWHPAIAESHIEAGETGEMVGAVRAFRLADGSTLARAADRPFGPRPRAHLLPARSADAARRLRGDDAAAAGHRRRPDLRQWESRFRPPPERAGALSRMVSENIYEAGFAALQARFAPQAAGSGGGTVSRPVQAAVEIVAPAVSSAGSRNILEAEAIVVEAYGGPEVLTPRTVRVPPPGPGEVRLRHGMIGVNFIDIYCRTGFFNLLRPPGIPGMEGAGTIIDVGPGVDHLRAGRAGRLCLRAGRRLCPGPHHAGFAPRAAARRYRRHQPPRRCS